MNNYALIPISAGDVFGRWTVTGVPAQQSSAHTPISCRCACGAVGRPRKYQLIIGGSASCGCLRTDRIIQKITTHGAYQTREYIIWSTMIQRCVNPHNSNFQHYGARGIAVCDRWRTSFEAFLADVGRAPGRDFSIDRIDNDGNYEPDNVRWATAKQQVRNSRRARLVTVHGVTHCIAEWAEIRKIPVHTIYIRIHKGIPDKWAVYARSLHFGDGKYGTTKKRIAAGLLPEEPPQ